MADVRKNVAASTDENEAKTGDSGDHAPPRDETLTLELLQVVKDAQQKHGLRHADYQRYRSYCSRRLRRLRKTLKFVYANRNRYHGRSISPDTINDIKYLYIPLFSAERAWSYAMQLKQESNTEPRKKFHMNRRLCKAIQFCDQLQKLCQSHKCDARSKLESQAYSSWMHGVLNFENQKWTKAIELFTTARTIYEKLSNAFTEEQQLVYQQRVEEIVPSIRYCAYNIGDESAINDLVQMRVKSGERSSDLDSLLSQTREKQAATLNEVTWRGRTVPVRNEKVRVFLLNEQESYKELNDIQESESKVTIYDRLLMECRDVLQLLRDELKADMAGKGRSADDRVNNLQYLHSYLTYLRLTQTIERNILLTDQLKASLPSGGSEGEPGKRLAKPQDLIRLYDVILQNLGEIPLLPGLENDDQLKQEIEAQASFYKAVRCFYVAQSYVLMKKWAEAAVLFQRTHQHASSARKLLKGTNSQSGKEYLTEVEELMKNTKGLQYSTHASAILDSENLASDVGSLTPDEKNPLHQYREDYQLALQKPNFVKFPPDFQPIPCKPLFFDIALNHVAFPSLEDTIENKQQQKKAGGGITGFVKGWLWGGGKK